MFLETVAFFNGLRNRNGGKTFKEGCAIEDRDGRCVVREEDYDIYVAVYITFIFIWIAFLITAWNLNHYFWFWIIFMFGIPGILIYVTFISTKEIDESIN